MELKNNSYTGYWFIPSEIPKKWYGTLTFSKKNRISLEFVLARDELKSVAPDIFQLVHNINHQTPIPLINGYAKNTESNNDLGFTLVDLELTAYSQSGLTSITLEAKFCLNYYHIQKVESLLFKKLMLKFDGFDQWMDKYGFEVNSNEDPKVFATQLNYEQPKPIELLKSDNLSVYFFFRATSPAFSVHGPKGVIEQSIFLNIDFYNPNRIDELEYYIEKIQNFFTLINTYPTQRTDCQVKYFQNEEIPNPLIGDHTIDLIYKERVPDYSQHIINGSFLFTYSEVENDFSKYFQNWLKMYQLYEPALDQYFDTLYFNDGHVVSRFVNILSVLEIYHSRKFNQNISLGAKIKDLISQFKVINEAHFYFSSEFVDEVILIRKFFVHGTEVKTKLTNEMQRKENISKHLRSLENIFRIQLLLEIGLPEDQLSKMIKTKPWQWGISRN